MSSGRICYRPSRFARMGATMTLLVACSSESHSPEPNEPPVAVARVVLSTGPADETTFPERNAALKFDFRGAPIDVQLDATASSDEDGTIEKYTWQSAGPVADDGTPLPDNTNQFPVPEWNEQGWSADVATPTVRLFEPGLYKFNLWITDDAGEMGEPDRITFAFGTGSDAAVAVCEPTVAASVPSECSRCLCGLGDQCRAEVAENACGEDCWAFLRCLSDNCPNFRAMAQQMPPDFSCLTTHCSAEFAAGQVGASAAAACVGMCPEACRAF
jgi:hypothetical protein